MCAAIEKLIYDEKINIAINLLSLGKLLMEEIAQCSELPLEKIAELAENKSA